MNKQKIQLLKDYLLKSGFCSNESLQLDVINGLTDVPVFNESTYSKKTNVRVFFENIKKESVDFAIALISIFLRNYEANHPPIEHQQPLLNKDTCNLFVDIELTEFLQENIDADNKLTITYCNKPIELNVLI